MARSNRLEILPVKPLRNTGNLLRQWWLRYQLECSEGELAGIEREGRTLDEERRAALRHNLVLRSALRDSKDRHASVDRGESRSGSQARREAHCEARPNVRD